MKEYWSIIIMCGLILLLAFICDIRAPKHKQQEKYEVPIDTLKEEHLVNN